MHRRRATALSLLVWCAAGGCARPASDGARTTQSDLSRASVLTQHNDNARTGANLAERELTVERVGSGAFGFLFAMPVDGRVYAQPLYVPDLPLAPPAARRDVLYVATEHDTVFAFDANTPGPPLWQTSLGTSADARCFDQRLLTPEIGVTSTPVIDVAAYTIYVVAFTADDAGRCDAGNFHHFLYALDLGSGALLGPPTEITASAPIPFDTSQHLQRTALLLADGVLYFAFASHADHDPYHGWLFAYDAATLAPLASFVDTPTGDEGGIWMAGQGPSTDGSGTIFVSTGNGTFDRDNLGDSVIAVRLAGDRFDVEDTFTPYNQAELRARDLDLGSVGPMLVPGAHTIAGQDRALVVVGGKEGKLYLLDRANLGGYQGDRDHVLQTIPVSQANIDGSPVWLDDGVRARLYVWSAEDDLKAFTLADSATGEFLQQSDAATVGRTGGLPGGFLAISANGVDDGIVWAAHPWSPEDGGEANAIEKVVPGVLRAFAADDLSVELWNNRADPAAPPESAGDFAKFCAPTVANGKVYLPVWTPGDPNSGSILVEGLR